MNGYLAIGLSLLAGHCGCGYVQSGLWDEDPANWSRAARTFGSELPRGWKIIHSRYWRTPHFTYEGGYYFQIRVPGVDRKLLYSDDLVRLDATKLAESSHCPNRPQWFVPGPATLYEVWGTREGNYRMFVSPNKADVFVMDCQY